MQRSCRNAFATACFPPDHHRLIGSRNPIDQVPQVFKSLTVADKTRSRRKLRFQCQVFGLQSDRLKCSFDGNQELGSGQGLLQKVVSTNTDRFYCGFNRPMP